MTKKELVEGVDYILNEDGHKINPETGKLLKGFALNKGGINKSGRPKGSRNKSSLIKAQLQMDQSTEAAAELLDAIVRGDSDYLGMSGEVPLKSRIDAAKEILNKSIANEKEKSKVEDTEDEGKKEDPTEVAPKVTFSVKAK